MSTCRRHVAASAHAVRNAHVPIALIIPVSSATGTNSWAGDRPESGAGPAQESFDAGDRTGRDAVDRLVVQRHLAPLESVAKRPAQIEPALEGALQGRVEQFGRPASDALGVPQRCVGVAQHRRRVDVTAHGNGDTHAGRQRCIEARAVVGRLDRRPQLLGEGDHLTHLVETVDQDGELVAPDASHGVGRADGVDEALGERCQHLVAGVVTERVVDVLEVVEVDQHDSDRPALAPCPTQRLGDAVGDQRPIGEPGECIVHRLLRQRRLDQLLIGDVAHQQQHFSRRQSDAARLVARRSDLTEVGILELHRAHSATLERAGDRLLEPAGDPLRHDLVEIPPWHHAGQAGEAAREVDDLGDHGVGAHLEHSVRQDTDDVLRRQAHGGRGHDSCSAIFMAS